MFYLTIITYVILLLYYIFIYLFSIKSFYNNVLSDWVTLENKIRKMNGRNKRKRARNQFCPSTDTVARRTFDVNRTEEFEIGARFPASLKFISNVICCCCFHYLYVSYYALRFVVWFFVFVQLVVYGVIKLVCNDCRSDWQKFDYILLILDKWRPTKNHLVPLRRLASLQKWKVQVEWSLNVWFYNYTESSYVILSFSSSRWFYIPSWSKCGRWLK